MISTGATPKSPGSAPPSPRVPKRHLKWAKGKILWLPAVLSVMSTVILVATGWYVYNTMVVENPPLHLLLSASNANLLVSVLSQVFAMTLSFLFSEVFDYFRWQLAATSGGVSAATFFTLSSATSRIPISVFTLSRWLLSWGVICLLFPALSLLFGSILKAQATSDFIFRDDSVRTQIFAGLIPIDLHVLRRTPARYICLYFASWMPVLLDVNKFATPVSHSACVENSNCTAVFLPGGVESARRVDTILNLSLMKGNIFHESEAIRISDATGFLLTYQKLDLSFDFDRSGSECVMYGRESNNPIQICARNVGPSIAVGWAVCPFDLYQNQGCLTTPAWMNAPIVDKVILTAYRQKATTSYHARDFSILHTKPTGNADIHPLDNAEFRAIWNKILMVDSESNEEDKIMINSFTWSLAWLIRLYDDDYPDDSTTPMTYLQNFLAVPLQFTLACVILLNSTGLGTPANPSSSWLPDEMITTATGGVLIPRFVVRVWTWAVFLSLGGALILLAVGILTWIFMCKAALPRTSGFPELDIMARAENKNTATGEGESIEGLRELVEVVQMEELADARWPHTMALRIRNFRLWWRRGYTKMQREDEAKHGLVSSPNGHDSHGDIATGAQPGMS